MYRVRIAANARELFQFRPLWEELASDRACTIFQNFDLNLLALLMFSSREAPHILCVTGNHGIAIVPAVIRLRDRTIRLLGEELFDYRSFLRAGDDEVLRVALGELARLQMPLEIVAMREDSIARVPELCCTPFAGAPVVRSEDVDAETFCRTHSRLVRNLRRLSDLGYEIRYYGGENARVLREIYQRKAQQDPQSLFRDPERIEFIVNAALLNPELFEVFTLECQGRTGAALVTIRDGEARRFYTGWFAPDLAKHSPALSLIHHVTCATLAQGQDCDYMTGEQPYKLRLATGSQPLYRVHATATQLAGMRKAAGPLVPVPAGRSI